MSDNTVKLLLSTSGKSYKYANDPPNYEILMNPDYLNEFCYFPLVYGSEQENQFDLSDQVTRSLLCPYLSDDILK